MLTGIPVWITYLQALSTPAIAIAGVAIAISQHRLARDRFRYDLYERRLKVFEATRSLLFSLLNKSTSEVTPLDDLITFNQNASEYVFLFGKEVTTFIDAAKKAAYDYWILNNKFARLTRQDAETDMKFNQCNEEEKGILLLLGKQSNVLIEVFKPYLVPESRR